MSEIHEHECLHGVNRIPPELLSYIFALYDQATDHQAEPPVSYIQFKAPAVCRHWRKVALGTTVLWSTIRHVGLSSFKRTEFYLKRSGSTVPLDVTIWLTSPKVSEESRLKKLETYDEEARRTLAFIIEHGGSVSRWKSLDIGIDTFAPCVPVMDFLWSNHFPCLESLDFTSAGPLEDHPDDEQMFFEAYSSQTRPKLIFANPPPQLRSIKINGVMNVHIFGSISRHHFSGLSDIDISFAGFHPDINQIYSLLEANPCLASLCFNLEQVDPGLDDRATVGVRSRPRLTLSSLVSLSFVHIVNPDWNISVLKTFMAPALQHLKLSYWDGSDSSQLLADYISNQGTDSSPYFPITLNRLSFFTIMGDTPNPECLLRAYPNITVLHTGSLAPLLKRPWLLPNLRCLSVATQDAVEFKNVVLERCRDGLPLENVELRWFGDKPLPSEDEEQIGKIVNLTVSIILLHEVESRNPDDDGEEQP